MSASNELQDSGGGWIEWAGGECPVDGEARVNVRGQFTSGEPVTTRAGFWSWDHDRPKSDRITAYRIVGAAS